MGYLYVSSSFYSDPKILKAAGESKESVWLWIEALCWRSRYRAESGDPDWFVPGVVMKRLIGRKRKPLRALIDAGLVEPVTMGNGRSGYRLTGHNELWRMAAIRDARPSIPESLRLRVYTRDGFACVDCGTTERLTLDHIYPYSLGGPDTFENLQAMCRSCNSRKGARV